MAPRSGGCAELPPPTEVSTQPLGSATPAVFAAVTALDCHCHGRDLSSTEGTEGSPEASLDLSPKPPQHLQCFANGKHGLAAAPEGVAFSPSATAYPGGRTCRRRPPCQRGLWRPPAAHGSALAKSRCDCLSPAASLCRPACASGVAGGHHPRPQAIAQLWSRRYASYYEVRLPSSEGLGSLPPGMVGALRGRCALAAGGGVAAGRGPATQPAPPPRPARLPGYTHPPSDSPLARRASTSVDDARGGPRFVGNL